MTHVTHEQLTILHELGYPLHPQATITYHNDAPTEFSHVPSLYEVCDWLRDVKGVHVYTVIDPENNWDYQMQDIDDCGRYIAPTSFSFPTHPAALSAAIDTALKILKQPI